MHKRKLKLYSAWGLPLLGMCFMGNGIIRQEHMTVLTKAVNICLECIGVG